MFVYVIMRSLGYEGEEVAAVFASYAAAQRFVAGSAGESHLLRIDSWEVRS